MTAVVTPGDGHVVGRQGERGVTERGATEREAAPVLSFHDFVARRSPALVRSAWLLTGSEAAAEDLVQSALIATWRRWDRVQRQDAPEAYVRKAILRGYLSWRRRRAATELVTAVLPERRHERDSSAEADTRRTVAVALAALPPRQRATVVLRFFDDLSEAQTAAALGCSVGTVKSQTSKALATLRRSALLKGVWGDDAAG